MAKFHFLKGNFEGKLGEIVWSSWRGIPYAKTYTPPSNPKTPAQQNHRHAWGALGHIAKGIYEPILKPYSLPKPSKMTCYNSFLLINKDMMGRHGFNLLDMKIFDGPLPAGALTALTYDTQNKKVKFTWSTTLIGKAKATDKAVLVLVQNEETVGYGVTTRDKGAFEINVAEFQKIKSGNLFGYLAFAQEPSQAYGDEHGMTSITASKALVIAGLREEYEINVEGKDEKIE